MTERDELRAPAAKDEAALSGVVAWRIDSRRNAVVVTVRKGEARAAALSGFGREG